MIWVNDFWTLKEIPKWLKHAGQGEDYLGFSDLIFPWFLFVMGMSIPFSIENRINKNETKLIIFKHIFSRFIALITMGLFHMNMEMYNLEFSTVSKSSFIIITTLAFFMIWNNIPKNKFGRQLSLKFLPLTGIIILIVMYIIYVGKDYDGQSIGFGIHWWGILGLIGWVYAIAAPLYLLFRKSISSCLGIIFICLILNIISNSGVPYNIFSWQSSNWIPGNGGLHALAFGGIITSLFLMKFIENHDIKKLYIGLMLMSIISFILGLISWKFFIINKIDGTVTWILISLSTALVLFIFLHWIVDVKKEIRWYNPISTAGSATLTCYLIPYLYYNIIGKLGIELSILFTVGILGLVKSMIYSLFIISISWGLTKINIQLKI